jgi:hypothetical protein
MRLIALCLALVLPGLALAQPMGIAFVQAPEQSSGRAMGETPEAAFAAATQACVEGGALAEDCVQTNWCAPAGWSIDIFAQHTEGPHWHETVCGLPSEPVARAVAAQICDRAARPYLIECALVAVIDPEGQSLPEPPPK